MLNHTIVQGNLTSDVTLRYTQNSTPVCSFTVAWSERFKETENKLYMTCTAWKGTAELVCKNFINGQQILVEGKLYTREWQDKDGSKRSRIEMTVERVHFCGAKSAKADTQNVPGAEAYKEALEADDGEIPF